MRRSILHLGVIFFVIVFINSCSDTSTGDREFLQVFTATKNDPNRTELFAAFSDFSNEKLSANLVDGGNVVQVEVSPDGQYVAYVADQEEDEVFELYVVPRNGGVPVKVSGSLVVNGDVAGRVQWSPNSSFISYIADQDTNDAFELYTNNPEGSLNVKISGLNTNSEIKIFDTFWSPDSSLIGYVADQDTKDVNEIFVSTADGSSNIKVSGTGASLFVIPGTVIWSPNSAFIAYIDDQETPGVEELFVSKPDGSNVKVSGTLVMGGDVLLGVVSLVSWSPDSTLISYVANKENEFANELYAVAPDGSNSIKLSANISGFPGNNVNDVGIPFAINNSFSQLVTPPQWSPDGSMILYISEDSSPTIDLFVSSKDGSANTRISSAISGVTDAKWSFDGQRIAYGANQDDRFQNELYVASSDGFVNNKVSTTFRSSGSRDENLGPRNIRWSPDDELISYIYEDPARLEQELHVARVTDKTSTKLSTSLIQPSFSGLSGSGFRYVEWSTDGSRLSFISRDRSTGVDELFLSDLITKIRLSGTLVLGGAVKTFH